MWHFQLLKMDIIAQNRDVTEIVTLVGDKSKEHNQNENNENVNRLCAGILYCYFMRSVSYRQRQLMVGVLQSRAKTSKVGYTAGNQLSS